MNAVIGKWAFVVGIVIAVIAGILLKDTTSIAVVLVLAILGLAVGFLNVSAKETSAFLLAGIALVIGASSALTIIPAFGQALKPYLTGILTNVVIFVVPGVLVVALKSIFSIARDK